MSRVLLVLMLGAAVLVSVGFTGAGIPTAASTCAAARPVPAARTLDAANPGPAAVRWDQFYDQSGKLLPCGPMDSVGTDSLYWKDYNSPTYLKSSVKAQNPSPANRTEMSFHNDDATPCMDPNGDYVYEVNDTSLYRYSTVDGSMTMFTLAYTGGLGCATDGRNIYRPDGTTMYKYTMTGVFVNSTTTSLSCNAFTISCCRDTIWFTDDRYNGVTLYGYACSNFAGGSISHDATWDVGTGTFGVGNVAWDGTHFYVTWIGTPNITFKRFYPDRTLYSTGTVSIDPRSVMCTNNAGFKVLFAGTEPDNPTLRALIVGAAGCAITSVDYFDAGSSALPAHSLYEQGYRVIITFGGNHFWTGGAVFGDSLAEFVDLGGGALNMTYTTCAGGDWCIGGRYMNQYMPVPTVSYGGVECPSITILDSLHPIMNGVTAVGNFTCEPYTTTLRSPAYSTRIADWDVTNSYVQCAAFDSGGRRTVFLGYHPNYNMDGTGQWVAQLVNALLWMGYPALTAAMTAPNGGESWIEGTVHNITWTQSPSGVKDSIYYSTDAGSSWTGVAYYDPSPEPLQHAWTVPNTPTTQARVKVVTWDADSGRAEDASDANFTIEPYVGVAQPVKNALLLVFALYQPFPNPLASGAQIRYALPRPARVDLRVCDVAGTLVRRLVDGTQSAGCQSAYWNGRDERGRPVAPGVYCCRFQAGDFFASQKLIVRR